MTPEQLLERTLESAGLLQGDVRVALILQLVELIPELHAAYCKQRGVGVVAETVVLTDTRPETK